MHQPQIKIICLILLCFLVSCGQPATEPAPVALAAVEAPTPAPAAMNEANLDYNKTESVPSEGLTEGTETDASSDQNIEDDGQPVKATFQEKKIIRNGTMSVKANNVTESKKSIDALLKKLGAYYQDERLSNEASRVEYFLKIRIPSSQFESLIQGIDNSRDEIVSKQINAEDVTEEFVDLQARLQNKREYLERYKSILRNAKNVKEMMQVEENIRNLQEEIESKEGRLRYLNDQVSYSTLDLTLFHNKEFVYRNEEENSFSERAKAAFSGGWKAVIEVCLGLFTAWPFLLFIVIVFWVIRKYLKRKRSKQPIIVTESTSEEKETT